MKDKIDLSLTKSLLRKQWIESSYHYKSGHFIGFLFRLLIAAAFVTVFVVFFGKFAKIYTAIKTNNILSIEERVIELITIVYTALIIGMTIGAMNQINRDIFGADDIKLFAAMPVSLKSLYLSKLISIYLSQLLYAVIAVLAINLSLTAYAPLGKIFYITTAAIVLLLPLITIALGSVLALPFHLIKRGLNRHFVLNFIVVTAITGILFYAYMLILSAVKELLIGESLKYFFNEQIMTGIATVCEYLYPAKWIAFFLLGKNVITSGIGILSVLIVCLVISMIIIRSILTSSLQSRISGTNRFIKRKGDIAMKSDSFWSLVKKEFLLIFRTPSYMFSYFSVAVIMPIMVYTSMSIGSSLVLRLIGLKCNLELALFLTLLFSSLTNVFCATNISRDGAMFYSVKALPVSYKKVFLSKIFLCMVVTVLSQLASAAALYLTGYLTWRLAFLIFVIGCIFSFVYICIATRYDFNHAQFSSDDGEINESGAVIVIVVMGLLVSFVVGGAVFGSRILLLLNSVDYSFLSYIIAGVAAVVFAVLAYMYFIYKLKKRYYEFEGGQL
ncbi:MAG: hypothetical protein J1F36_02070 [Clostridiales bacterium]|nr:hypothetical protein [Clostridiales bacterium]